MFYGHHVTFWYFRVLNFMIMRFFVRPTIFIIGNYFQIRMLF